MEASPQLSASVSYFYCYDFIIISYSYPYYDQHLRQRKAWHLDIFGMRWRVGLLISGDLKAPVSRGEAVL